MITNPSMNKSGLFITSQEELDKELSSFSWDHAFISEAHMIRPSYVTADGRFVVAPDSPWLLRILICGAEKVIHPNIEFIFYRVDYLALSSRSGLNPSGVVRLDEIEVTMTAGGYSQIRAKRLRIRHLGTEVWGVEPYYTAEDLFDEGGFPLRDEC